MCTIWSYPKNQLHLPYGHFPKINTSYQGTLGATYKCLIYGHIPKINTSYQGTPGTTYKYLIDGHIDKISANSRFSPITSVTPKFMARVYGTN